MKNISPMNLAGAETFSTALGDTIGFDAAGNTLAESDGYFKLLVETIDDVFWMADFPITSMQYIGPAYEHVWGRTTRSLYENPRSFIEALHPEDRERVLLDLHAQEAGQPFDHEYRVVRPDGEIRWVWGRGFPLRDKSGRQGEGAS